MLDSGDLVPGRAVVLGDLGLDTRIGSDQAKAMIYNEYRPGNAMSAKFGWI